MQALASPTASPPGAAILGGSLLLISDHSQRAVFNIRSANHAILPSIGGEVGGLSSWRNCLLSGGCGGRGIFKQDSAPCYAERLVNVFGGNIRWPYDRFNVSFTSTHFSFSHGDLIEWI